MARHKKKGSAAKPQDVSLGELEAIVDRTKTQGLSETDHKTLKAAVDTLAFLTQEIENKDASISRLRKYLFGSSTEKTSEIFPDSADTAGSADESATSTEALKGQGDTSGNTKTPKRKAKGHGRNGADAYTGGTKVSVPHESLKGGDPCTLCSNGKVYPLKRPAQLVRITGMAPLTSIVYELDKLRCNLCGEVFTAKEPPGVGQSKYDEGAVSMIALLKYGTGMPFNRLEELQKGFGIPLPASTQWDLVAAACERLLPAYQELTRQAAQGDLIHNDDTTMQILELTGKRRQEAIACGDIDSDQRVGIYTSGIVARSAEREIVLFFTGNQHAGENLADVLKHREPDLTIPIQMCDALSHNTCGEFDSILSNCLTHARRKFVELIDNFPDESHFVIDTLREVYKTDAQAGKQGLNKEDRLLLHQAESQPRMETLHTWMEKQFAERLVEPNSGLGKAIAYTRKNWKALTLFLSVPGAPLDNNICERALKKVIMHRKNSYFYKTRRGARVGDLFMSLIYTAERAGAAPFAYLTALQKHAREVANDPGAWMPWNYTEALARLDESDDPVS